MAVRTTIDIPEPLHELLREKAARGGTSIRALILRALDQCYRPPRRGARVTGALVDRPGKLGPDFPTDENPHDLVFS